MLNLDSPFLRAVWTHGDVLMVDFFCAEELLDSFEGGPHLQECRNGCRKEPDGVLEDVEDNDCDEGLCCSDLVALPSVEQEGSRHNQGRAEPVHEYIYHVASVHTPDRFELSLAFAVEFLEKIFLQSIYFDKLDYLKDLLGQLHSNIFGLKELVILPGGNFGED